MNEHTRLSELPSACPYESVRAGARVDPYWDGVFAWGSNAVWLSRSQLDRAGQAGLVTVQGATRTHTVEQAVDALVEARTIPKWLSPVAVIDSYRTASGQHIAALSGRLSWAGSYLRESDLLFAANVIDRGRPAVGMSDMKMWRPSRSTIMDKQVLPHLSFTERVSTTGAQQWNQSSQFDRHNILATELLVRAAELLQPAAVLGEKFSSVSGMVLSGTGGDAQHESQHRSDGVLVRGDGVRVAIELTASAGPSLEKKVRWWARFLSERAHGDTGVVVIFVVCDPPENTTMSNISTTLGLVSRQVARAVKDYPGSWADRTAARMGVVHWADWFPASNMVTQDWLTLVAKFPLKSGQVQPATPGHATESQWEVVPVWDQQAAPFTPVPGSDPLAVARNARLLRATPEWLPPSEHATDASEVLRIASERHGVPYALRRVDGTASVSNRLEHREAPWLDVDIDSKGAMTPPPFAEDDAVNATDTSGADESWLDEDQYDTSGSWLD